MKRILYLLPFLLLFSCQSEVEWLEARIKQLHDEDTMPKMATVQRLISELEAKIDEPEAKQHIAALSAADDSMSDWMAAFSWKKDLPETERIDYYQKEVEKLEAMKIQIDTAVQQAESYLGGGGG